jgi:uncharacterized membrane protein YciS (DUF1049 family)
LKGAEMHESNSGAKHMSLLTNVVFITGFVLLWMMLSILSGMADKKAELSREQIPDKQVSMPTTVVESSPTVAGTSVQKDVEESLKQMDDSGISNIEQDYQ